MNQMDIYSGLDLKQQEEYLLIQNFGKAGRYFYKIARGIDNRPVSPDRIRKSISAESTFFEDLTNRNEILEQLDRISANTWQRMTKSNTLGRTVTIKVRFDNFDTITRSKSFPNMIENEDLVMTTARELLLAVDRQPMKIRLCGVGVSNWNNQGEDDQEQKLKL